MLFLIFLYLLQIRNEYREAFNYYSYTQVNSGMFIYAFDSYYEKYNTFPKNIEGLNLELFFLDRFKRNENSQTYFLDPFSKNRSNYSYFPKWDNEHSRVIGFKLVSSGIDGKINSTNSNIWESNDADLFYTTLEFSLWTYFFGSKDILCLEQHR